METPKISIIVPVYKAEAYLHRCVDSLLAQTMEDFELLLVDDGSPDRSGAMCDEYAATDSRVRVIHQPNGGVSSARQRGLDEARGEYVIHADPDDWVEKDMLEELYKKATEEDADMVICDFYVQHEGYMYRCHQKPSALDHDTIQCELFQQLHGSCCNKLVKRACYNTFHLSFPKGISYCEDLLTNVRLLANDIKVAYLPKAFYHYDQTVNANSIVRKYTVKSFEDHERMAIMMAESVKGTAAETKGTNMIFYSLLERAFIGNIFSSKEFAARCGQYKEYCHYGRRHLGIFIRLSCLGHYRLMYQVWHVFFLLQRLVRTTLKPILKPTLKKLGLIKGPDIIPTP